MKICALLLSAWPLWAAMDGTVINRTSGQPQPGVNITLVKPGAQGMQTIGTTVSDAAGHFAFEKDQPGGGPQLLQANYEGVNYNKLMTPNIPTSNIELEVFESTKSPAVARVDQRMLLIEPASGRIAVSENIILKNESTSTYNNPAVGGIRFFLPAEADGQVQVRVQGPQGMPLPKPAEKTETRGVFKVDYPIKPGETQFEVDYVIPIAAPFTLRSQVVGVPGMPSGPLRLIAPAGVTLKGGDLQSVGTEPKTQASIYTVKAAGPFSAEISGAGSLRSPEVTEADPGESPAVTEGAPQIYTHLGWLLGLGLGVLGVGLAVLFVTCPKPSN